MKLLGGVEAGGTKFVCGIGTGPDDLETIRIPTTDPDSTLGEVIRFFRHRSGPPLVSIGIGAFGPVDLNRESPTFGCITSTPKNQWQFCDITGILQREIGIRVMFDTDVNAAALGEGRWGAATGLSDFLYLTVGTGIGGGALVHGRLLHGLLHPEMGHIPVPHDLRADPFPGSCVFHGDCLEGLAAGPAIESRWGLPAVLLPSDHPAWALEAHYLALGIASWTCTLSPQRIVLGGGVMDQTHLFPLIRRELARILNHYIQVPELAPDYPGYIVPAQLGARAGILGALVLAEQAYTGSASV